MSTRQTLLRLAIGLLCANGVSAQTYSPVSWTVFDNTIQPYRIGGIPARDVDGAGDGSVGVGNTPDLIDIASGDNLSNANCNPASATGRCGTSPSTYLGIYDAGTVSTADDMLFFRLRVADNPRGGAGGGSAVGFGAYHWNVLLSVDADNYKEFWIDVFGGFSNSEDAVRIFHEDIANQEISSDVTTLVAWLDACNSATATCGGAGRPSFTRVVDDTARTPDEYFVDIQVPVPLLDDTSGTAGNPNEAGTSYTPGTQIVTPSTNVRYLFSTSASNTDPLQKDYSAECLTPPTGTCNFGDDSTTPVSLASAEAVRRPGGLDIEFSTLLEVGHAGFEVQIAENGRWKRADFVPADPVDRSPFDTRRYRSSLSGYGKATQFRLIELDAEGKRRIHGPYPIGIALGQAIDTRTESDWSGAESDLREFARHEGSARLRAMKSLSRKDNDVRPLVEVTVDRPGAYLITSEHLASSGVDMTNVRSQQLKLTRGGASIPLRVAEGINAGIGIEFVADYEPSLYSASAVFTLWSDPAGGARMQEDLRPIPRQAKAAPYYMAKRVFDRNLAYSFSSPTDDPWYDTRVLAYGAPAEFTASLMLDQLYPGVAAEVRTTLWGGADLPEDGDHHAVLSLNGRALGELRFEALDAAELVVDVPPQHLLEGANPLRIALPNSQGKLFDLVNYDKSVVTYPRRLVADEGYLEFQVAAALIEVQGSDPDAIVYSIRESRVARVNAETECHPMLPACTTRFAGSNFETRFILTSPRHMGPAQLAALPMVPSLIKDAAEYLVITHPTFRQGADQLAERRRSQGLSAQVVDVRDVYRAYGNGVADAAALRGFIADAAARMGSKFVLLVGGDSFDYHNNLGLNSISHIPSAYVAFDDISRFVPSDSDLADVDRDGIADLAIGRLPARTQSELAAMIDKIIAYEDGFATSRVTIVADRGDAFAAKGQVMADMVPDSHQVSRILLDNQSREQSRAMLFGQIGAGLDLVQYYGHSAPTMWSFDSLLTSQDAATLVAGRPFLAVQYGCWNAYYVDPRFDSTSRTLLANPTASVAAFGPTGLADEVSEAVYSDFLTPALFTGGRLGDRILQAKRAMALDGVKPRDIHLGLNLLGDPALLLK